jgi:hypothetical protein
MAARGVRSAGWILASHPNLLNYGRVPFLAKVTLGCRILAQVGRKQRFHQGPWPLFQDYLSNYNIGG